jgi:DNA-binding LytR/AlgR family response regulator
MIKCIIIDDEQPARELIAHHLSGLGDFELLATFDNPLDAFGFLQKNTVDLAFVDIKMPRISGIDLVKSLKTRPQIILTTAFREYAAEGFELDVLDYIVKPVTAERFMQAISKFSFYNNSRSGKADTHNSFDTAYIFLKVNREHVKVYLKDIFYIEGFKDYIKVHIPGKVLLASERLNYMEATLPESKFARIHKSFIVALEKISHYNTEDITIGKTKLPIGRVYKKDFSRKLLKNK